MRQEMVHLGEALPSFVIRYQESIIYLSVLQIFKSFYFEHLTSIIISPQVKVVHRL